MSDLFFSLKISKNMELYSRFPIILVAGRNLICYTFLVPCSANLGINQLTIQNSYFLFEIEIPNIFQISGHIFPL